MARSRLLANVLAAINGIPIGGTTPAAGAFTSLSVTGTTALTGPVNLSGSAGVAGQILKSAGAGVAPAWGDGALDIGTPQTSTSGTVREFLGVIPSWARRVTVSLAGVSTSGTSALQIQLGTSGGFQATGYLTTNARIGASAVIAAAQTTGWVLNAGTAASTIGGSFVINLVNEATGTWSGGGIFGSTEPATTWTAGSKALSGVLDRIRVTTVNGTDTFDAGTINIMWE